MSRSGTPHGQARLYRRLLGLYPPEFRARYADDMVQLFDDQLRDARSAGSPAATARTWLRAAGDLAATAASEHLRRDRTMAHSLAVAPSGTSRLLGLAGVLGGLVLLVVFVIPLAPELNTLRLVLFSVGAIAVIVGVHLRQTPVSRSLSLLVAGVAILANLAFLGGVILGIGRPQPPNPDPDFRLVMFYVGLAMWLADAAFGLVALRLGAVVRWGALALAVGSVLAILGIDRLELVSGELGWLVQPVALFGIALNGVGWIALGIDVAIRGRRSSALPDGNPPAR